MTSLGRQILLFDKFAISLGKNPGNGNVPHNRQKSSYVPNSGLYGRFNSLRLRHNSMAKTASLLITSLVVMSLNGCTRPTTLETIQQEGALNIVTIDSDRTVVEQEGQKIGFEYELTKQFAEELGVELNLYTVDSIAELYDSVNQGYAAFSASGIALEITNGHLISPTYATASTIALYRQGHSKPRTAVDLLGKKVVSITDSPAENWLKSQQLKFPEITWQSVKSPDIIALFASLHNEQFDVLIASEHDFQAYQAFFPELRIGFNAKDHKEIGWIFKKSEDLSLYNKAVDFITRKKSEGNIAHLTEKYYGHQSRLDFVGAKTFNYHTRKRLPKYRERLEQAAEKYQQDYYLLAAIGYQESHWNPRAVSPTGVKGFMMLTLPTAKDMGVSNRLNADQSIEGGARYLSRLHKSFPKRIQEPDRTWFSLAAYNVGKGHLEDARILTQKDGKNPDKWADVKEYLPLLQDKRWYKQTKHGYARGYEPVVYVQNIRRYIDVLRWNDNQDLQFNIAKAQLPRDETTTKASKKAMESPTEGNNNRPATEPTGQIIQEPSGNITPSSVSPTIML